MKRRKRTIIIVALWGLLAGGATSSSALENSDVSIPTYEQQLDGLLEMRRDALTPEQVSALLEMAVGTTQRTWEREGWGCLAKVRELDGGPLHSLALELVNFEKPLPGVAPLVQFFAYQRLLDDAVSHSVPESLLMDEVMGFVDREGDSRFPDISWNQRGELSTVAPTGVLSDLWWEGRKARLHALKKRAAALYQANIKWLKKQEKGSPEDLLKGIPERFIQVEEWIRERAALQLEAEREIAIHMWERGRDGLKPDWSNSDDFFIPEEQSRMMGPHPSRESMLGNQPTGLVWQWGERWDEENYRLMITTGESPVFSVLTGSGIAAQASAYLVSLVSSRVSHTWGGVPPYLRSFESRCGGGGTTHVPYDVSFPELERALTRDERLFREHIGCGETVFSCTIFQSDFDLPFALSRPAEEELTCDGPKDLDEALKVLPKLLAGSCGDILRNQEFKSWQQWLDWTFAYSFAILLYWPQEFGRDGPPPLENLKEEFDEALAMEQQQLLLQAMREHLQKEKAKDAEKAAGKNEPDTFDDPFDEEPVLKGFEYRSFGSGDLEQVEDSIEWWKKLLTMDLFQERRIYIEFAIQHLEAVAGVLTEETIHR